MQTLCLPLSNRADFRLPPDGKVQVVPVGEYPISHQGKTIVQVVDAAACRAMLNNLRAEAANPNFGGLCIDYDHFRHDPEKSSRAAGWVMEAEGRAEGIYCAPRWSSGGRVAVEGGEYRSISPEFDPSTLEALGDNRYRVTRLVGFGLTNSPNMRGMAALTNRQAGMGQADDAAARAGLIADLARTLRAEDTSLSLSASYVRAENALDAKNQTGGALVIANRARALRAADKTLSLSTSYRLAQETPASAPSK